MKGMNHWSPKYIHTYIHTYYIHRKARYSVNRATTSGDPTQSLLCSLRVYRFYCGMKKRSDFALGSLRRHLHGGHLGAINRQQHQQECCLLLRQYTPTSIPSPSPASPSSSSSSSSIYSFSSRPASSSSSSSAVVAASSSEIRRESHHHFNEPIERVVNAFTGERQENDELMQYTVQVEDHHHFQEKIIRTKQKPSNFRKHWFRLSLYGT